MEEKSDNRVEKIKLAKELVVLLTVIFGLVLLVVQSFYGSDYEGAQNDENVRNTSKVGTKEEKTINTIDSSKIINLNPEKRETEIRRPIKSTPIKLKYDTIEVFVPSRLEIDEVKVDGETASILQFLPTKIKILVEEKNNSQLLTLKSNNYSCSLQLDFANGTRYSVDLQQNCIILPN